MSAEVGITAAQARQQARAEHEARAAAEQTCRLNFLVYGDAFPGDDGQPMAHAAICVCSPACSRDYDPLPYPEAEPVDAKLYAGTAIGALYGLGMTPHHAASLAGWNLTPRSERYE